jgi:hypothetical protein
LGQVSDFPSRATDYNITLVVSRIANEYRQREPDNEALASLLLILAYIAQARISCDPHLFIA